MLTSARQKCQHNANHFPGAITHLRINYMEHHWDLTTRKPQVKTNYASKINPLAD